MIKLVYVPAATLYGVWLIHLLVLGNIDWGMELVLTFAMAGLWLATEKMEHALQAYYRPVEQL